MTERQSIEIDYCPQCRGVWLDRGELDKIIERSSSGGGPTEGMQISRAAQVPIARNEYKHGHDDKHAYDRHDYQRKKSVWQELFD
jgi:Zn-finger nucleic acid-binding protein